VEKEALQHLRESDFEVIVTDLRMPGMSGDRLLEIVSREHSGVMQLMLSSACESELRSAPMGCNVQVLSKLASTKEVVTFVERALAMRKLLHDHAIEHLIQALKPLSSIPDLDIHVRQRAAPDGHGTIPYAEIHCPILSVQLQLA
jgi:DNA-binding NarL/FixJ family response regulator